MKRALNILMVVLLIAGYGNVMAAPGGGGGTSQVTVVNTAANPVPVSAPNPLPVNVQNQPTVNIGTMPSVNIGNQPSVNINGTPNVNIVNNKQTYLNYIPLTINAGEGWTNSVIEIPAGRRLIIEYVSYSSNLPNNNTVTVAIETCSQSGVKIPHYLPTAPFPNDLTGPSVFSGQVVNLRSDGYCSMRIGAWRMGLALETATVTISLSGYLEDM